MPTPAGPHRFSRLRALALRRAVALADAAATRLTRWARATEDPGDGISPAAETTAAAAAEVAAEDDAARLRAAMDLAVEVGNVGLWDASLATGTHRYNSQLHAIYGLDDLARSSAPGGKPRLAAEFLSAIPPEDMGTVIAAFEVATNERRRVTYEHRYVRSTGEVRRVRSVALVLSDGDAVPHRAIGTTVDVTEAHALTEALQLERERLILATQIAGIGIWELDIATGRYFWDAKMHELYGLEDGTFAGTLDAWLELVDPVHRERLQARRQETLAPRCVLADELTVRRKDGTTRTVRTLASVIHGPDGTPVRAVGCNWDITQERQLGETLRRAKDAADQANRAKSAFLANMSHEIRTPMNGVLGMADLALGTDLSSEQRDLVSTIHASAESLLVVIDDILDYSKIEAGKLDIAPFPFALRPALDETLIPLQLRADLKGVELVTEVEDSCPTTLCADWSRIRQVITNLVGNAVKFTSAGKVTVRLGVDPEPRGRATTLRCTVSDTGVGIEPAVIERIFAPFDQAHPGVHATYGGSGLGLSIAAQLVGLMGGEMMARSTPSEGSTFGFEVPVEIVEGPPPAAAPRPRRQTPTDDTARTTRLRVLVAEDHRVNQRVIQAILERSGHVVRVVENGREAVRAALDETFDVILMDIEMPELDGLEATARIRDAERTTGQHVPIVALTAHAMTGDRERILAAGIDDYLTKPLRSETLLATVERVVSAALAGRNAP